MRIFTLEYWQDESWYVGRLKEVASVFEKFAGATDWSAFEPCPSS